MQDIIANGLGSIQAGLEDFERAGNSGRLTSAVRNVYAGILILAKGKLYEMSPPGSQGILIRVVRPKLIEGKIELVPEGRKTIEYEDIKQRFRHFGLALEWDKIERIRNIRNDLEHFYHPGSVANVREALADAATVIRSLLRLLNLNPVEALGQQCWEAILQSPGGALFLPLVFLQVPAKGRRRQKDQEFPNAPVPVARSRTRAAQLSLSMHQA